MRRDYYTLDAIVVCASLVLLAGFALMLVLVKIPAEVLPILASLGTGVLAILTAYVGARWGNKKPGADEPAPGSVTATPPHGRVTVDGADQPN